MHMIALDFLKNVREKSMFGNLTFGGKIKNQNHTQLMEPKKGGWVGNHKRPKKKSLLPEIRFSILI